MTNKTTVDSSGIDPDESEPVTTATAGDAMMFSFGDALPPPCGDRDRLLRAQLDESDSEVSSEAALMLGATYSALAPRAAAGLLLRAAKAESPVTAGRALLRMARLTSATDEGDEDERTEKVREYLDIAQRVTSGVGELGAAPDPRLLALCVDIATALMLAGSLDMALRTLLDADRLLRSVGDPDRWGAPRDEGLRPLAALISLRLGQILTESDPYAADEPLERAVMFGTGSVQATAALERGRLLEHHAGGQGPEIERQYMLAVDLDDPVASPLALVAVADILWESGRQEKARKFWEQAAQMGDDEIARRVSRRFSGDWQSEKKILKHDTVDERLNHARPLQGVRPSTELGRLASGRARDAWPDEHARPVVVVGAGTGGHYLLPALAHGYNVIGFVDDDPTVKSVRGVRVLGTTNELVEILRARPEITQVIFAVPTAPGSIRLRVLRAAHRCGLQVVSLPSMFDLRHGHPLLSQLRPFEVHETYGDTPWTVDRAAQGRVRGRRVAIVGAGSVLGTEFARRMVQGQPRHLLLIDEPPVPLMRITDEIRNLRVDCDARIADYANHMELTEAFRDQPAAPEIVFYCGGVDYAPRNALLPSHAARANVLTVSTVATVTREVGCAHLLVASADRAGHRASWFDMTKALAEVAALGAADDSAPARKPDSLHVAPEPNGFRVSVLRLPNLWAKDGAVVGRLSEQLARGGPLRVKDGAKRRFAPAWDAAQTMLRLLAPEHSGGLFALATGDLVEIRELAERLILIQGLVASRDIRIVSDSRPDTKVSLSLWGRGESCGLELVDGAISIDQQPSVRAELDSRLAQLLEALSRGRPDEVEAAIQPIDPPASPHGLGYARAG